MKFQCGECDKCFKIDNIHIVKEDLNFRCDNCGNEFFINSNLAFSSSSKNSKIICENCGRLIHETNKKCDSCNLVLSKAHEDLRIDNKSYEALEINQKGNVYKANSGRRLKKGRLLMPGLIAILILSFPMAWYFINTNQKELNNTVLRQLVNIIPKNKNRIETQIVILKSGQTYYADKIEYEGLYIKIINKNGLINEVLKKNVLQISKAVIED